MLKMYALYLGTLYIFILINIKYNESSLLYDVYGIIMLLLIKELSRI